MTSAPGGGVAEGVDSLGRGESESCIRVFETGLSDIELGGCRRFEGSRVERSHGWRCPHGRRILMLT